MGWNDFDVPAGNLLQVKITSNIDTRKQECSGIRVDGRTLVDTGIDNSSAGSFTAEELTFDSPKDLVNFRPGDVVQNPNVKVVSNADAANSKMTVDGGRWSDGSGVPSDQNQDDAWSDYFFCDAGFYGPTATFLGPIGAFDGDPNTACLPDTGQGNTPGSFIPPTPIPFNTLKLTFLMEGSGNKCEVNAGSGLVDITSSISSNTYTTTTPGNLTEIKIAGNDAYKYIGLALVEVDGKILVDPGQSQVTGPLCQGTGEYVSHTANTLELTNAGGRWMC